MFERRVDVWSVDLVSSFPGRHCGRVRNTPIQETVPPIFDWLGGERW